MSAVATRANPNLPTAGEQYRRQVRGDDNDIARVPAPKYRHAAPSAPWPWMKFDVDAARVHFRKNTPGSINAPEWQWNQYPQSLFANWTPDQVNRSQMLMKCANCDVSIVYKVNMFDDGKFCSQKEACTLRKDDVVGLRAFWDDLKPSSPSNVRIQALFVEDMSVPVLQMLGTRYNVEPFFFASSANWIPSGYQEDPKALKDHITVILPFIRVLKDQHQRPVTRARPATFTSTKANSRKVGKQSPHEVANEEERFDTQAPLPLPENKVLIHDLLSLHIVRNTSTSTIISYHPDLKFYASSAIRLQSLVKRTGDSVYWTNIFKRSKDPTFLFLAILWYALYAWDEAFELLGRYIGALEHDVLKLNNIKLTRELHQLRAHILYYQQLLRDFRRSVQFVRDTPNPAMNASEISEKKRKASAKLLRTEANILISEIERVSRQRELLSDRVENALNLAFATVKVQDSKAMQRMAEATRKDAIALKQIAYITVFYLPGMFVANAFRMYIPEINLHSTQTLARYLELTFGLTLFTSWITIAFQRYAAFFPEKSSILRRALWPFFFVYGFISTGVRWLLRLTGFLPTSASN